VSSSVLPQPSATPSGKGATPTGTPAAPAAASWHEVGDAAHTPQKPQRPPAGGRGRLRPRPTASTLGRPPAAGEVLAGRRPRHVPSERTPNRTRPLEHDRKDGVGLRVAMLAPPWISVPPPGYGGVECVVSVLTQALVKRGNEVTLFCAPGSTSSARVVTLLDEAHSGEIERSLYEADHVARAFAAIDRASGERPFDVVHDHCGSTALGMADRLATPLVHTLHGQFTRATSAFYTRHESKATLVAISRAQRATAPEMLADLAVIPNPIELQGWPMRERKVRRRLIDHVWMEEISVVNHRHESTTIDVTLELDTDFADLFEVKDGTVETRTITSQQDNCSLTLSYERQGFRRSVTIASSVPATITRAGFTYSPVLASGEQWSTTFTITPDAEQPMAAFGARRARDEFDAMGASKSAELHQWLARAPALVTSDPALLRTYRASLSDLGALRLPPDISEGATPPAAGLPWFMALFGRDSLIAGFQALPYLPELAATTLRVLAAAQADDRDDFHEREPGKILHELRFGELTARGERPYSLYFGSADATPLFLILLDEYHRWSGDDELVRALEPSARAALAWIEDSGDVDGDGYVEYSRRNSTTGLANQCWKDSWDAIQFADGTLPRGPIATCEIQGYVYDARSRAARLSREVWGDRAFAERLESQARDLQRSFHRDFWMPERGCHAVALDGDKRQVDSLTSNTGHLLWSGLLDKREAATMACNPGSQPQTASCLASAESNCDPEGERYDTDGNR
jgi:glycogen debranching enzyme